MSKIVNNQLIDNFKEDVDLREYINLFWANKFPLIAITSIFFLSSVVYALLLPNIYRSVAYLAPVEGGSQISGIMSEYSGMASLAGLSVPQETSKNKEAVERIKSFHFFSNHFLPFIMLEDLLAVKDWDLLTNKLSYDDSEFNSETRKWVRKAKPPRTAIPSAQEAYKKYKKIMSISVDKKSEYVTLSIDHQSPYIAQQWVEVILKQIDRLMRDNEKSDAMNSVEYLNAIAPTVNYDAIKKAFSMLQQEQMKRLMMVEANANYIFTVLDAPIASEERASPKRTIIVIIGSIIGFILGCIGVLAHYFYIKPYNQNELSSS